MGTDIDYLMLHGRRRPTRISQKTREKDESVLANLRQYSCESKYLDVVVADSSQPLWRAGMKLDAIITDPPYGIREATERVGTGSTNTPENEVADNAELTCSDSRLKNNAEAVRKSMEQHCSSFQMECQQSTSGSSRKSSSKRTSESEEHIPAKVEYNLPQLYSDLLDFASEHLAVGGRLICWFPVYRDDYDENALPKHKNLQLVANSEQPLSRYTARRMLTYERLPVTADEEIIECDSDEPNSREDPANEIGDFRQKYFVHGEETRKEKRMKRVEARERGRVEKQKRERSKRERSK